MTTNLLISLPYQPVRCFQISPPYLRHFGSDSNDLLYRHYCDLNDRCRSSYPCLKSDIYNRIINKLYNIDYDKFYLLINSKLNNGRTNYERHETSESSNYLGSKELITITVLYRILGGKGGFGKILKTQASKKRQSNNLDSCRNLQGQRIRTVRLSDQMNKWKEKEETREKLDKDIYKLPKKEDSSVSIKKENFVDEKYVETVKKEVSKVKETVLRGFDKKLDKESQEFKIKDDLESKRSTVLDACLDVYDL